MKDTRDTSKDIIVTSVALEADVVDVYGDIFTIAEVKEMKAAYEQNSRLIDVNHDLTVIRDITVLDSYMSDNKWILTTYIPFSAKTSGLISEIENGTIRGMSVSIAEKANEELIYENLINVKSDYTLDSMPCLLSNKAVLANEMTNPTILIVSYVRNPAFSGALIQNVLHPHQLDSADFPDLKNVANTTINSDTQFDVDPFFESKHEKILSKKQLDIEQSWIARLKNQLSKYYLKLKGENEMAKAKETVPGEEVVEETLEEEVVETSLENSHQESETGNEEVEEVAEKAVEALTKADVVEIVKAVLDELKASETENEAEEIEEFANKSASDFKSLAAKPQPESTNTHTNLLKRDRHGRPIN